MREESPRSTEVQSPSEELAGRQDELATLATALDRARAGSPSLVVIEGPGGMGKTAVLERFGAQALSDGAVVVRAAGDRVGGALPLQPVLDALATTLRGLPAADRAAALGPDAELVGPLLRLIVARQRGHRVVTSDPDDLQRLDTTLGLVVV